MYENALHGNWFQKIILSLVASASYIMQRERGILKSITKNGITRVYLLRTFNALI